MSINKVFLKGRLGADPEIKSINEGSSVCTISVATQYGKNAPTQWHKVELWNKSAELVHAHFRKGQEIVIEGAIQYDSWTDRDGKKRTTTKIRALSFDFCGDRQEGGQRDNGQRTGQVGPRNNPYQDDNVPF